MSCLQNEMLLREHISRKCRKHSPILMKQKQIEIAQKGLMTYANNYTLEVPPNGI